ncbi:hypothetical protein [Halotalea alkalilenta]|nr:hypothetical protein [Halotalea alkalilenta]
MQQSEEQQWVLRLDAILSEAESDEEIERMLELLDQWADEQLSVS